MLVNVVVDVPIKQSDKGFTYLVPAVFQNIIAPGVRVIVPFGKKQVEGIVLDKNNAINEDIKLDAIKPISKVIDPDPVLSNEHLQLGKWMAERYFTRTINAWQTMLPAGIKTTEQKLIKSTIGLEEIDDFILTAIEKEILTYVAFEKQVKLTQILDKYPAAESAIAELKQKQYITEVSAFAIQAKPKTLKYIKWSCGNDIKSVLQSLGNAKKQIQIAQLVYEAHKNNAVGIAAIDLEKQLGPSRQSITSLKDKGIIDIVEMECFRTPARGLDDLGDTVRPDLTQEQKDCLQEISKGIANQTSDVFLLHGVTGSGKTEVYMQAIHQVVEQGLQAIVLVPEISLTPQMVDRFKGFFGNKVAVMHSRLSRGERYDEWRRIKSADASVVIGARSAIFAPCSNLGIIIIDEEHEGSYKQEETPRYDAREIAFYRSKWHKCPIVLGSATPSIESYYYAQNHKYKLLSLKERVFKQAMPKMHVVDMKKELKNNNYSIFSQELQDELQQVFTSYHQSILFINRRGHSNFVMCRACGEVSYCPYCNISLTYHKIDQRLQCHYCNYHQHELKICPKCKSDEMHLHGIGTEKIELELNKILPDARVLRMDVDTTKKKGAHQRILEEFKAGKADILIGTQMVAKGLDFPNVALVGVISADVALNLPDFRATERTFQLITQVGGRAGRHQVAGKVIVQSHNPDHYSIKHAINYEYELFYTREISLRKQLGYPPFSRLIYCTFSHTQEETARLFAQKFSFIMKKECGQNASAIYLLGPNKAVLSKIKNRYRYSLIIKYAAWGEASKILRTALSVIENEVYKNNVIITIDVNPQMLL
ncbi:primosomal protein N' [Desulfuribacillus alkaliarsenatis]|uniref:Replication restart protein PriA n=1 Tax=Desulfuribacillus alkaliarsenatis TaxID=766136 RepID=A0A1E5G5S6_9FIRM|nr:primosomal protein N' [Desulfuribacillus alkaliarsenatis]OEF98532.1 primosomal protein N' [Desulfuribacillus alkaliarsenatis]